MPTSYFYTCYALRIVSDMLLPEMGPSLNEHDGIDVTIRQGAVNPDGLAAADRCGPVLWATPTQLQLHVPGVARFLVSDGATIIYDPEPGIDEDSVRVFMLGSALGALLFQRGFLVLHGNAIQIGDGCVICVGHSGAGKSTLAAAFMQRGFPLLADDVVPVDKQCRAIPGFPRIKLWQDTADKMGVDTSALRRIRPEMAKFNLPVDNAVLSETLPIHHIYVLKEEGLEPPATHSIRGLQKFPALYANTYRQKFLTSMELRPDHLKLCGQLAGTTPISRLERPRLGFTANAMVDLILAEMAERV